MRRIATLPALLIVWLPACGDGDHPGPITDVALETGDPPPGTSDTTAADDGDSTAPADASTGSTGDVASASTDPTGVPASCGDGVVDDGEACDGAAIEACGAIDPAYTWGDAGCTADCRLDLSACQTCQAPALVPCDPQSDDPFHALELGCPDLEGWSVGNGVPLLTRHFASVDTSAYRVLRRFGSHMLPGDVPAWAPRAGERMLLLGTGAFSPPGLLDNLVMPPGAATAGADNTNPDADGSMPASMRINMADGSLTDTPFEDCDRLGDCSQTLSFQWLPAPHARDIAYLDLQVRVPPGTRGYALDMALFTAHYPEYAATIYNDMAILWSESEAFVGNVSHLMVDGIARPFALPSLASAGLMTHDGATDPMLLGTGYDGLLGDHGGATDWLTLHGPAVPGEALTLALAVFDLEDTALDSALLVDHFRWRCEACTLGAPADAGGCGLRPASR